MKKIAIFLILFLNQISANKGKIIAFSGLSGSGKSTMARALSKTINASCVEEPEECNWTEIILKRDFYGASTAMLEFRQMWAKMYLDAADLAKDKIVFIDTYFFKIFGYYLNKPGMEWLVPLNDPYLDILLQINKLDQNVFPDADCVVLLDIDISDWKLFLKARGRDWDKLPGFLESYAFNKKYIADATIEHCKKHSIKLINFKQEFGDACIQAEKLKNLLVLENFI